MGHHDADAPDHPGPVDRAVTKARLTAADVIDALRAKRSEGALAVVRKRLEPDEEAFGVRMGELFAVAKAHTDLPLVEVDRLFEHPAYEPRMAAICILDFKARGRIGDEERRELSEAYLGHHERITTWDMVDRAAPWVVGGHLAGRSVEPLVALARAEAPLRRRTAITAPLWFVRFGSDDDLAAGFNIAALLARDAVPVAHNAVGIFLKHAGSRDGAALRRFLDEHARTMPRPALRLAIEKLDPAAGAWYLA
jgi:3-methyladenine DNA glycosylase AlkD